MLKPSLLPPNLLKHRILSRHQLAELLNLHPNYALVASAKGVIPRGIRVAGKAERGEVVYGVRADGVAFQVLKNGSRYLNRNGSALIATVDAVWQVIAVGDAGLASDEEDGPRLIIDRHIREWRTTEANSCREVTP